MKPTIGILGAGAWGTALAAHLAEFHESVVVWGRHQNIVDEINQAHTNAYYLPDINLPSSLKASQNLQEVVTRSEVLLLSVPSAAIPEVMAEIRPWLQPTQILVLTTKGFAPSGILLHQYILETFTGLKLVLLSGPSFAREVARGFPTAVTLAAQEAALAEQVAKIFVQGQFYAEISQDMTGVQLGGAIKNVLAIAMGIMDGLGFGTNTISALLVFGLREAMHLAAALGAKADTLLGLSGLGDLVLTGTDNQSRNRRFGLSLGEHHVAGNYLVEGAVAAKHIASLAERHHLHLPICLMVHQILEQRAEPQDLLNIFKAHL